MDRLYRFIFSDFLSPQIFYLLPASLKSGDKEGERGDQFRIACIGYLKILIQYNSNLSLKNII